MVTARRLHRVTGVVVAPVMIMILLGIQSSICSAVRLVLRYSVRDLQFHVLRNPARSREGGPTVQSRPCLRNPVERPLSGFHSFSWSVLSCRPMYWIDGWITSGSLASSVGGIDRDSYKFRTAKQESSYGQYLGSPLILRVIRCTGVRCVSLSVRSLASFSFIRSKLYKCVFDTECCQ